MLDSQTWGESAPDDKINVDWVYDADTLRLSELKAGKNAATKSIQQLVYSYDDNGSITQIVDHKNSVQYQCYSYGDLNRLLDAFTGDDCAAADGTGSGSFDVDHSYDVLGNLSVTGGGYSDGNGGNAGPHAADAANSWTSTYDDVSNTDHGAGGSLVVPKYFRDRGIDRGARVGYGRTYVRYNGLGGFLPPGDRSTAFFGVGALR